MVADSPAADLPLLAILRAAGVSAERATRMLTQHAATGSSSAQGQGQGGVDYSVEYQAADGAKLRLEAGEHETFEVAAPLLARLAVLASRLPAYATAAASPAPQAPRKSGSAAPGDPSVALVSAVVGRLLRGVAASVVNDPQVRGCAPRTHTHPPAHPPTHTHLHAHTRAHTHHVAWVPGFTTCTRCLCHNTTVAHRPEPTRPRRGEGA